MSSNSNAGRKSKRTSCATRLWGGDDADAGTKMVVQLNDLVSGINAWRDSLEKSRVEEHEAQSKELVVSREQDSKALTNIARAIAHVVEHMKADAQGEGARSLDSISLDRLTHMLENTLQPLIKIMYGKLDLDLGTHKNMADINRKLAVIDKLVRSESPRGKPRQTK